MDVVSKKISGTIYYAMSTVLNPATHSIETAQLEPIATTEKSIKKVLAMFRSQNKLPIEAGITLTSRENISKRYTMPVSEFIKCADAVDLTEPEISNSEG